MTDEELVKRLRKRQEFEFIDGYKRVEWEDDDALEAADRIEELEAKLAKAVEALDRIGKHMAMSMAVDEGHLCRLMKAHANATLAELKGDKT